MTKRTTVEWAGLAPRQDSVAKPGFTLVELLVVIGIIAVLIGILLPTLSRARASAVDVQCKSNLKQLFLAQTFYHDAYKRYTPVRIQSDPHHKSWPMRLAKFIDKSLVGDPQVPADTAFRNKVWAARGSLSVLHCPAANPDLLGEAKYSYGINPFTQMPSWNGRRDRKAPMSSLILMADKPIGTESQDFLITEDGIAFYYGSPVYRFLYRYPSHNNLGAHRHTSRLNRDLHTVDSFSSSYNPAGVNALFGDGHVERLSRLQLRVDSGFWYFGETNSLAIVDFPGLDPCCQ